jgi:hypothetical protein
VNDFFCSVDFCPGSSTDTVPVLVRTVPVPWLLAFPQKLFFYWYRTGTVTSRYRYREGTVFVYRVVADPNSKKLVRFGWIKKLRCAFGSIGRYRYDVFKN